MLKTKVVSYTYRHPDRTVFRAVSAVLMDSGNWHISAIHSEEIILAPRWRGWKDWQFPEMAEILPFSGILPM